MEQDILYFAAKEYAKLKSVAYKIKVGRKGKSYEIFLHFPYESFYHLVGMQHLEDLVFPSKNKERIFKEILKGNIGIDYLEKSQYYTIYDIEKRINNLYLISEMLENNKVLYKINPRKYSAYTTIKSDYVLEYNKIEEKISNILYLFLIMERNSPRFENEHKCCSFFRKYKTDYTCGTMKTTLLVIEKIQNFNTEIAETFLIYKNPSYKESER